MRLISVSFKCGYKEQYIGDTIWKRLRSAYVNRCSYEKCIMGEFWNVSLLGGWLGFGDIKIYLASVRDWTEKYVKIFLHDIEYHKQIKFEELDDDQKFIAYKMILTENIVHEYYHYIFADLKLGLTSNQQHYAIGKIIQVE